MRKRIETACIAALFLLALLSLVPAGATAAENAPQSTETVCLQCHSGLPEKYSQPVKLWRGSVQAESGVTCHSCHGGDPNDMANAMSPERGFLGVPKEKNVPAFCGRCHIGVLKDYMASAHGMALGKNGPTCVTCHGSHAVLRASLDLINEKSCTRCHSFDRARLIREAMKDTEGMITDAYKRLKSYKKIGSDTEKLEKSLFAVRNSFHTLFHDVDVEKVKKETAQIQGEVRKVSDALDDMDATKNKRKKAGAAAVAVSLLAAVLFYFMRKTYS
jgi:hypothetical protein